MGNSNAQGYEDFTGMLQNTLQLMPGTIEPAAIIPGFSSSAYKEFFRIYIDFNMDGDFSDPGEMAFDPGWATDDPVYGEMSVPSFSAPGLTRMRVMMKIKAAIVCRHRLVRTLDLARSRTIVSSCHSRFRHREGTSPVPKCASFLSSTGNRLGAF